MARTEQEEKKKRVKNVVIRGLKEEDDLQTDLQTVKQIINDIGCSECEIEEIQRLGKKTRNSLQPEAGNSETTETQSNRRFRPVRVVLKEESDKWQIVRNATKVRKVDSQLYDPKKIFICPDHTKLEREKDIELRKNLKKKREEFPNEKFTIRNWKIVKL